MLFDKEKKKKIVSMTERGHSSIITSVNSWPEKANPFYTFAPLVFTHSARVYIEYIHLKYISQRPVKRYKAVDAASAAT